MAGYIVCGSLVVLARHTSLSFILVINFAFGDSGTLSVVSV